MIEVKQGDIWLSSADGIVIPVNTDGVMGKGLALQFAERAPLAKTLYERACHRGLLTEGRIYTVELPDRKIVFLPTKTTWRAKSRLTYIESGLAALVKEWPRLGLKSIAVPALGCGAGKLDWADVKPILIKHLEGLDAEVELYEPRD